MVVNAYLAIYDKFSVQRHGREWTKITVIFSALYGKQDFDGKAIDTSTLTNCSNGFAASSSLDETHIIYPA
jgi:hypothetical protein